MRIRLAVAADAPLLPPIERSAAEAFRALPDLAWIADDDVMDAAEHLARIAAGTTRVAEIDGAAVAFLSVDRCADALHIREISVAHAHQGKGIGRALLDDAADWARAAGLPALTLTTFRDVPWNAPFYTRAGFVEAHDARLAVLLEAEAARGLAGRCAMRRALR